MTARVWAGGVRRPAAALLSRGSEHCVCSALLPAGGGPSTAWSGCSFDAPLHAVHARSSVQGYNSFLFTHI